MYEIFGYRNRDTAGELMGKRRKLGMARQVADTVAAGGLFADVKRNGLKVVYTAEPKPRQPIAPGTRIAPETPARASDLGKTPERGINFKCTIEDARLINEIVKRGLKLARDNRIEYDAMSAHMDVTAAHCNGCPLKLAELLAAPDADFGHDFLGIRRHIDRRTGKLGGCFLPRLAQANDSRADIRAEIRQAAADAGMSVDEVLGITPEGNVRVGDTTIIETDDGVSFKRKPRE